MAAMAKRPAKKKAAKKKTAKKATKKKSAATKARKPAKKKPARPRKGAGPTRPALLTARDLLESLRSAMDR